MVTPRWHLAVPLARARFYRQALVSADRHPLASTFIKLQTSRSSRTRWLLPKSRTSPIQQDRSKRRAEFGRGTHHMREDTVLISNHEVTGSPCAAAVARNMRCFTASFHSPGSPWCARRSVPALAVLAPNASPRQRHRSSAGEDAHRERGTTDRCQRRAAARAAREGRTRLDHARLDSPPSQLPSLSPIHNPASAPMPPNNTDA
jgi:hypothetical protein